MDDTWPSGSRLVFLLILIDQLSLRISASPLAAARSPDFTGRQRSDAAMPAEEVVHGQDARVLTGAIRYHGLTNAPSGTSPVWFPPPNVTA